MYDVRIVRVEGFYPTAAGGGVLPIRTARGLFSLSHGIQRLSAGNTVLLLLDYCFHYLAQPNPDVRKLGKKAKQHKHKLLEIKC